MAVHQVILKFKNSGIYAKKKWSGISRKPTPRDVNLIRQKAVQSPTSSCRKIRPALLLKGTNVHRSNVSRCLVHDFKLKACKLSKQSRKPTPRDDNLIRWRAVQFPTSSNMEIRSALLLKGKMFIVRQLVGALFMISS